MAHNNLRRLRQIPGRVPTACIPLASKGWVLFAGAGKSFEARWLSVHFAYHLDYICCPSLSAILAGTVWATAIFAEAGRAHGSFSAMW